MRKTLMGAALAAAGALAVGAAGCKSETPYQANPHQFDTSASAPLGPGEGQGGAGETGVAPPLDGTDLGQQGKGTMRDFGGEVPVGRGATQPATPEAWPEREMPPSQGQEGVMGTPDDDQHQQGQGNEYPGFQGDQYRD